jgi:hypothetical protein
MNNKCATVLLLFFSFFQGCDDIQTTGMKGQRDTTMQFYAKAVDEDGQPLSDVQFEYAAEAYPKDWTFEKRARPKEVSKVSFISSADGTFKGTVSGSNLNLIKAERVGYHHLFDEDLHSNAVNNRFYLLISWGDLCYKTDADHPAVYGRRKRARRRKRAITD